MHSDNFKELLRLSPLKEKFFQTFYTHNFEIKKKFLVKNMLQEYLDYLLGILYSLDHTNESVRQDNYEKYLHFEFENNEIYCKDENNEVIFELSSSNVKNKIWIHFQRLTDIYFYRDHLNQDDIAYYINKCIEFIDSFNQEAPPTRANAYINYIYSDLDSGLLLADLINYQLTLFNEFCLSLVKGEYLLLDNFSTDYLNDPQRMTLSILYDEFSKVSGYQKYDDDDVIYETDPQTALKKFFDIKCKEMDNLSSDINIKLIAWGQFDYLRENEILKFYNDFAAIRQEYFYFNRKIDAYSDLNNQVRRIFDRFDPEQEYTKNYESAIANFSYSGTGIEYSALSRMFPFLFRKMLDMSLIDHNFISSTSNLWALLKLNELLKPTNEKNNIIGVLKSIPVKSFIDKTAIDHLLDTLDLIRYKNNFLIFKMLKRAGSDIRNYAYIGEQGVTIINHFASGKSFYAPIYTNDFEDTEHCDNILSKKYLAFLKRDISDSNLGPGNSFYEYEKCFMRIICRKEDYTVCKKEFKDLETRILDIVYSNQTNEHNDINSYNEIIKQNFIDHFKKYGLFIKELKIDIQEKDNGEYLERLLKFVKGNKSDSVLSCGFIIEHLKWALGVLEKDFIETDKEDKMRGFEYIDFCEILLKQFKILINHIEEDHYCLNYSSFFKHCFFIKDGTKLSQYEIFQNNNYKDIVDEQVLFISSTWQPPIGIHTLKEHYNRLSDLKDTCVTRFNEELNNNLLRNMENKVKDLSVSNKKEMDVMRQENKEEIDDNKRTTVQTLGIFAAFLALATISLGSLSAENRPSFNDVLKFIFSMTTCLGYFVLLLHLIIYWKRNDNYLNFIAFLMLVLIIVIFLFVMTGHLPFF